MLFISNRTNNRIQFQISYFTNWFSTKTILDLNEDGGKPNHCLEVLLCRQLYSYILLVNKKEIYDCYKNEKTPNFRNMICYKPLLDV